MSEDLDYNPFWTQLQTQYSLLYDTAQANCWVICIPSAAALAGVPISRGVIESHVLKHSPYFRDVLHPVAKGKEAIEVAIEKTHIVAHSIAVSAKILSEELFYNAEYKQFKVLIIDSLLLTQSELMSLRRRSQVASTGHSSTDILGSGSLRDPLVARKSLQDYVDFLDAFSENAKALRQANAAVSTFNKGYVIVKGFLPHTAKKIESLTEQFYQSLLADNRVYSAWQEDKKVTECIRLAAESYILSGVYQKLFHTLCSMFEDEDAAFYKKTAGLANVTAADLSIQPEFWCDMRDAVKEVGYLDALTTPLEKLHCMRDTTVKVTQAVERHLEKSGKKGGNLMVATDDMIPLLARTLILAKPSHFCTNMQMVENFHLSCLNVPELNFALVSFQAASSFINSPHIASLADSQIGALDGAEDGADGDARSNHQLPPLSTGIRRSISSPYSPYANGGSTTPSRSPSTASSQSSSSFSTPTAASGRTRPQAPRSLSSMSRHSIAEGSREGFAAGSDDSDPLGDEFSSSGGGGGGSSMRRRTTMPSIRPPDVISVSSAGKSKSSLSLNESSDDGSSDLGDFLSDLSISSSAALYK